MQDQVALIPQTDLIIVETDQFPELRVPFACIDWRDADGLTRNEVQGIVLDVWHKLCVFMFGRE